MLIGLGLQVCTDCCDVSVSVIRVIAFNIQMHTCVCSFVVMAVGEIYPSVERLIWHADEV